MLTTNEYIEKFYEIYNKLKLESTTEKLMVAIALTKEVAKDQRSIYIAKTNYRIPQSRGFADIKKATDRQKELLKELEIKFDDNITSKKASSLISEEVIRLRKKKM